MAPRKKRRVSSSDEGSEDEQSSGHRGKRKSKVSQIFSTDDEEESEWEADDNKRKRPTPSKPAARGRRASAKQLQSSSDENDSDTSVASDEDDLYENEEERKKFESMTQVEREMFLYERQQKRELERERRRMLKELERKKRSSEGKAKKEKEPSAPRRKPEAPKKQAAIEWSDSESSEASGSEVEEKRKPGRARQRERTPEPVVTVDDLNSIRLSRHKLETWHGQPFFEDAVKGCFVRLNIGSYDGQPVYRVVEVVDLVQSNARAYTFNGKPCNTLLLCKFGEAEKPFQMKYVSNTPFTEDEVRQWKEELEKNDVSFPAPQRIDERRKAIADAINFRYTDEDVERIVQEKRQALKSGFNPDMYVEQRALLVAELTEAKAKLDAIEDEDDKADARDEVDALQRRVDELEQQAQDYRKQFDNRYGSISKINQRALARNIQSAPVVDDPRYVREPTRPIMLTVSEKQKLDEQKRKEKEEEEAKKKERAELEAMTRRASEAEAKRRESVDQDSLADLHSFDLGLDIDVSAIAGPNVVASASSSTAAAKPMSLQERRAMRLSDYKAKKGLI